MSNIPTEYTLSQLESQGREYDAPEYNGSSVKYAIQRPHTETNAGTSLKPYAIVLGVNELEKVRWTGNSRWHLHTTSLSNKHQWQYEI